MVMVGLHRSAFHLQLAARRHAQQGVLKITPIEKSTPPEAEVLAARFYDVLPRIRITDLLFGGGAMDAGLASPKRSGYTSIGTVWPERYPGSL